jgi:hypothetical protein
MAVHRRTRDGAILQVASGGNRRRDATQCALLLAFGFIPTIHEGPSIFDP